MYDLWMRKDTYMTSKFVMLAIMLALGAGAVNAQNPLTDWSTPPCSKGGLNPPTWKIGAPPTLPDFFLTLSYKIT